MTEQYLTVDHLSTQELTRIFARVYIDPISQCWNWTGTKTHSGYGNFSLRGKRWYIHRLMYAWICGPIHSDWKVQQVDHLCKNPSCCNPVHLDAVTPRENMARSSSHVAANMTKTHCLNGHPLTGDNLGTCKKGKRFCYTCKNAYQTTDHQRAKKRAWKQKNIEKIRAQNLATYHRNAEKNKAKMRERYHRLKKQSSDDIE